MFQKRFFLPFITVILLLLVVGPVLAGGWSVTTLDKLPDRVIAGEPVTVGFVVRQHGVTTLADLKPTIVATRCNSDEKAEISVEEDTPGHYTAELTFPGEGVWNWSIAAFGPDQPLPALNVLPADAAADVAGEDTNETVAVSPEELIQLGTELFVAKGCVVCHQNDGVDVDPYESLNMGPELTGYGGDADFLRQWLADPSAVKPDAYMPTLGLSDDEIEALIAFLAADSEVVQSVMVTDHCEDAVAESR